MAPKKKASKKKSPVRRQRKPSIADEHLTHIRSQLYSIINTVHNVDKAMKHTLKIVEFIEGEIISARDPDNEAYQKIREERFSQRIDEIAEDRDDEE
jgi:ABC-type phosphate/phosphonate transport system ATPase subunit